MGNSLHESVYVCMVCTWERVSALVAIVSISFHPFNNEKNDILRVKHFVRRLIHLRSILHLVVMIRCATSRNTAIS
jgi:hypothetical protein